MIVQPPHTAFQRIERPSATSPTSIPNRPASVEPAQSFSRVYSEAAELDRIRKRKDIMSNYDMTNMSINELEKMGRELYDAGVVDYDEYVGITFPIHTEWIFDAQRNTLIDITDKNRKQNLLSGFKRIYESVEKYIPDHARSIDYSKRILNLAESLHWVSKGSS